jgi:hypothetical protein
MKSFLIIISLFVSSTAFANDINVYKQNLNQCDINQSNFFKSNFTKEDQTKATANLFKCYKSIAFDIATNYYKKDERRIKENLISLEKSSFELYNNIYVSSDVCYTGYCISDYEEMSKIPAVNSFKEVVKNMIFVIESQKSK